MKIPELTLLLFADPLVHKHPG